MYLVVNENGIGFAEAKGGIETIVYQSNWNIDNFNGNGPSGITLTEANMLNCLLIVLDQEWLGVGRIRCGFNISVYAFSYSNTLYYYPPTTYNIWYNGHYCNRRSHCDTSDMLYGYVGGRIYATGTT
jgi:hypothetical protein